MAIKDKIIVIKNKIIEIKKVPAYHDFASRFPVKIYDRSWKVFKKIKGIIRFMLSWVQVY